MSLVQANSYFDSLAQSIAGKHLKLMELDSSPNMINKTER